MVSGLFTRVGVGSMGSEVFRRSSGFNGCFFNLGVFSRCGLLCTAGWNSSFFGVLWAAFFWCF